jgi:hypothetical protein
MFTSFLKLKEGCISQMDTDGSNHQFNSDDKNSYLRNAIRSSNRLQKHTELSDEQIKIATEKIKQLKINRDKSKRPARKAPVTHTEPPKMQKVQKPVVSSKVVLTSIVKPIESESEQEENHICHFDYDSCMSD